MPFNRDRAGKLGLAATTFGVCLVGAELTMRQLHPLPVTPARTTRTQKAQLYGWAPEPGEPLTVVDPETGERWVGRANSQGWRDVEHSFEKPPGQVRVLFVGDSFTYGSVPLEALYTRRVEAKLHELGYPQVEVISIGVGGWGPDQELEAIQNEGIRYHPDLIVYQFCSNDIANIDPPRPIGGDMSLGIHKPFRYVVEDGKLRRIDWQSVEAMRRGPPHAGLKRLLRASALFRTVASVVIGAEELAPPADPAIDRDTLSVVAGRFTVDEYEKNWSRVGWKLFEALVAEMAAVSKANGAEFLVFSEAGEPGMRRHLLDRGELASENGQDYAWSGGRKLAVDMRLPLRRLAGVCERSGIGLIEPKRTYERYSRDWHTDRAGNENMASDIVDFLAAWPPFQRLVGPPAPAPAHGAAG